MYINTFTVKSYSVFRRSNPKVMQNGIEDAHKTWVSRRVALLIVIVRLKQSYGTYMRLNGSKKLADIHYFDLKMLVIIKINILLIRIFDWPVWLS